MSALSGGVDLRWEDCFGFAEVVRVHGRTAMIWLIENLDECRCRTAEGFPCGWRVLYALQMERKMSVESSRRVLTSLFGMRG